MTGMATTDELFYGRTGLDRRRVDGIVGEALAGADDGELFLEYAQSEKIDLENGEIRSAAFDTGQGFGLRAVSGETTGYAHAGELSEPALRRAADTVRAVQRGRGGTLAGPPRRTNQVLYDDVNPLGGMPFEAKIALLSEIDGYLRAREPRIRQVMASLSGSWQAVQIVRADGRRAGDVRPLVSLRITVTVERNGRLETGTRGAGGRAGYAAWVRPQAWQAMADEALRQALVNLESVPAPAGDMPVVLGPGWPGVMLHEAVGHGLEGDFNRKRTSAFTGLMGERVASPDVTVVDDGTMPGRRGSVTVDDEGTPGGRTVLIENGRLTGYMQDRMNARLMDLPATGNGRRQSYAHAPMPRMTNTFMLAGARAPEEIIAAAGTGVYAVDLAGGQVNITSGEFVFSCTEAYRIENGRIGAPIRGATLAGRGADALTRVTMVGDDLALDPGIGLCGKDGHVVPVGVGQPTMLLSSLTVGGTAA